MKKAWVCGSIAAIVSLFIETVSTTAQLSFQIQSEQLAYSPPAYAFSTNDPYGPATVTSSGLPPGSLTASSSLSDSATLSSDGNSLTFEFNGSVTASLLSESADFIQDTAETLLYIQTASSQSQVRYAVAISTTGYFTVITGASQPMNVPGTVLLGDPNDHNLPSITSSGTYTGTEGLANFLFWPACGGDVDLGNLAPGYVLPTTESVSLSVDATFQELDPSIPPGGMIPPGGAQPTSGNAIWAQPQSGSWSTQTNWLQGVLPSSGIDTFFNTGSSTPYTVGLTGASAAKSVTLQGDNVTLSMNNDTLNVGGAVTVDGFGGQTGSLFLSGPGTVSAAGGVNVTSSGKLSGNANIVGNVTNSGVVAPGGVNPGVMTISGNYTQNPSGALNVRINGASSSGSFDSIAISGNASLAGSLAATLGSGFVPSNSDSFQILSAGSVNGKFSNGNTLVVSTPNSTGQFTVKYAGNSVTLSNFNQDEINFYHEPAPKGYVVGHAFLEMSSRTGANAWYGFYPAASPIYGPGQVDDDKNTPWDYRISYAVTDSEYISAASVITADLASPPTYSLTSFNCVDWISKIATAANITLPPTHAGANELFVSDPTVFGNSLSSRGDGSTFDGGLISSNSGFSAARLVRSASTTTTPYDYSYGAIESLGHSDPESLATAVGFPLDKVDLGTVNANSLSGLSLSITGADTTNDLISMNWGDGSPYEEQSLSFDHVYSAGTYLADLLVMDTGAVHSYDMRVQVSSGPGALIAINVSPFPAVDDPNAGLSPGAPVPDLPEPASLSLPLIFCAGLVGRRRSTHPDPSTPRSPRLLEYRARE